jgi:transcriptional regulator GlxA family with amidase domain
MPCLYLKGVSTGDSPHRVLNRIRLTQAERMLKETASKLEVVASSCGFGDRVNMHRSFKKVFWVSPAAYRQQIHKQ